MPVLNQRLQYLLTLDLHTAVWLECRGVPVFGQGLPFGTVTFIAVLFVDWYL